MERRHRHRGEGRDGDRRRRQRPLQRRDPRRTPTSCGAGGRRGRQPRVHAPRAGRVRRPRRAHQRRLHRQLGRRRLLRPRGQPEDPARPGGASRRADAARARRADGGGHRGRGRARALRLVPAGADHRPGGRAVGRADVRLRGPDRAARGDRPARPREREPARRRRDHRAPPRRAPDGAAGAGDPASPTPSGGSRGRWRRAASRTTRGWSATCAPTSPNAVVERCGHLLHEHPLRTQLVCMINANSVVNALGPTFVSQLVAERSADVAAVVRAFRIAVAVTGADEPWEAIEGLDDVERSTQMQLLGGVDALVEATARWYLMYAPGAPFEETVAAGRDGFVRLEAVLGDLGTEERRRRRDETIERLTRGGRPAGDRARPRPPRRARPRARRRHRGHRDRPLDRGRRARVLRDRRRAQARLDGARARARAVLDADAAVGAAGGARGRVQGAPRPRRGRPAREPDRRAAGRGRAVPARARRPGRAPGVVPARPGPRGRIRPRGPGAGGAVSSAALVA